MSETTIFSDSSVGPPADPTPKPEEPSRFQKRIDELSKQKYEAIRQLDASRQEQATLAARLEALEARLAEKAEEPKPSTPGLNREWKDLTEPELASLVQENSVADPTLVLRASKELARREAEALIERERGSFQKELQRREEIQTTWATVNREFGPDAQNPQSRLRQEAEAVAARITQKMGKDAFQQNPDLLYFAFAEADRRLKTSAVSDATKELERLRTLEKSRSAGVEPLMSASEARASKEELLKRGDVRGAIGQLDIIRVLRGEPRE